MTTDPTGAAQRLLNYQTNTPGFCLRWCAEALLLGALPEPNNAGIAWDDIPEQYRHKGEAPLNFPAWFRDDVTLGWLNGNVAATDANSEYGHTGYQSYESRAKQVGPYLGWSNYFLGEILEIPAPPPQPTPPPKRKKIMPPFIVGLIRCGVEISVIILTNGIQKRSVLGAADYAAWEALGWYYVNVSPVTYESYPLA
jgi:hypothetical protein